MLLQRFNSEYSHIAISKFQVLLNEPVISVQQLNALLKVMNVMPERFEESKQFKCNPNNVCLP